MPNSVRIERLGDVLVWTVDRPQAKNALSQGTIVELAEAFAAGASDPHVRAAIVMGGGGTFVSGGDLRELRDKNTREDAEHFGDLGFRLCHAIGELPFPVIAAVDGAAIGGGAELAVSCDLRIADAEATISFKQARMGVTTGWGGAARLLSLVAAGTAARLLYAGHDVGAEEALRIGLVDHVAPAGTLREVALAWASDIARASPTAIAAMKRVVREATGGARKVAEVRAVERALFAETWSHPDHREAVEAFFERRPARWSPRGA